jgi:hypothetical protein
MTERARREVCRRVGRELDTVAEVAREFGVGWFCAHQAVIDYGDELIADDARIERVMTLARRFLVVRCSGSWTLSAC